MNFNQLTISKSMNKCVSTGPFISSGIVKIVTFYSVWIGRYQDFQQFLFPARQPCHPVVSQFFSDRQRQEIPQHINPFTGSENPVSLVFYGIDLFQAMEKRISTLPLFSLH